MAVCLAHRDSFARASATLNERPGLFPPAGTGSANSLQLPNGELTPLEVVNVGGSAQLGQRSRLLVCTPL